MACHRQGAPTGLIQFQGPGGGAPGRLDRHQVPGRRPHDLRWEYLQTGNQEIPFQLGSCSGGQGQERLVRFKVPRCVIVNELPDTLTGKIDMNILRDRLAPSHQTGKSRCRHAGKVITHPQGRSIRKAASSNNKDNNIRSDPT